MSKDNLEFQQLGAPLKELLQGLGRELNERGLEPEPAPAPPCRRCAGVGYRVTPQGPRAVALPCGCERPCTRCGSRGFLLRNRDGYTFTERCECQSLNRRIAAFNEAQIPASFADKTFDNYYFHEGDPREVMIAKREMIRFANSATPGQLGKGLFGGPGRGKTHLLTATLARMSLERGISCRYVEISFLFADLRAAISDPQAKATVDKIDELAEVDVLAIDELGKGRGSVFEEEVLDELIGRRYNNGKSTLFATNYSAEAGNHGHGGPLRDRVGERVYSRLHSMAEFIELPAHARNYRIPGG